MPFDNLDVGKWVKVIENVRPFPHVVGLLIRKIDDPEADIKDIEDLVGKDVVIAAKVLKMANSAYYGFPKSIDNLHDAILILGMNTIKSIVIAIFTKSVMNVDASGYGLVDKGDLWKHSVLVASGARYIAKKLKLQNIERFFVAGLLHDIGKVVISEIIQKYKMDVIRYMLFKNMDIPSIEDEIVGINHNILGEMLAKFWNFPDFISQIIKYHDDPLSAPDSIKNDVLVVSSANKFSYKFVQKNLVNLGIPQMHVSKGMEYLKLLKLDDQFEDILGNMSKFLDAFLEV